MEDINSYIVLSMNDEESINFFPNFIDGQIPNLYIAGTSSQKILPNIEFLVPQNTADSGFTSNENLIIEAAYSNNDLQSENEPVENTIFKCSHCADIFDDQDLYLIHEKTHQAKEDQLKCTKCNKPFQKVNAYKRHLLTHQDDKIYNCAKCDAGFNSENNYNVHMALHGNSSVCPVCGLSFNRMASLKSHLAIHQVEEFHSCPECSSEFENMIELRKHMKTHTVQVTTDPKLLVCSYCKVTFETEALLKQHVACHRKVKKLVLNEKKMKKEQVVQIDHKHKCKVCGKTFPKLSLLDRHIRIHNGERPFVCQICYKGFTQKGTLQIHMLKHSGIKPFCCTLCPAKFHQKGNLKVHVQKTHTASSEGEKSFKCSECDCIFKKVASLNGHMTKIHADSSVFNITTVIDQLKNLRKQLNGNSSEPEQEEVIENPHNLNKAEQLEDVSPVHNANDNCKVYSLMQKSIGTNKVYICSYCDKEMKKPSDLIRHIRTHTKERPFECHHCNSSFALKSTLLSHMQIHKGRKCGKCSKVIFSTKVWKAHTRKHATNWMNNSATNEQESVDNAATDSVSPNSSLKRKKVISEKPLKCLLCSASFLRKVNLNRHLQLHSGEKTFKCLICSRIFITVNALKEHMKSHNTVPKNLSCDLCDKKFTNPSLLKRHVSSHDDTKPFECPYCKKRFKNLIICRKHIDTHGETKEAENVLGDSNIFSEQENIPLVDSSENSLGKTTLLTVNTDGVVFDNPFNMQQNLSTVANSVLEQVQTMDQSAIPDPQHQNLQTILVNCQGLQNEEVQNYILSQLKLQTNDAIVLNTINENDEQCPIVFNVQTVSVDSMPDVGNAINEITYANDIVEKSADPVLSFSDKGSLLENQKVSSTLDPPGNSIPNDIGDNYLSNNVSLYPNTPTLFDSTPELNTSTMNIEDSPQNAFIEVLVKSDSNGDCNLVFDVAKGTPENVDLNLIHCMVCKKLFDAMESYQKHACMKSILKKSNNTSLVPEESKEPISQKKCNENKDVEKPKEKSKKCAKRFFRCVYCVREFTSRGIYMKHVNSHQKKENGLHKCKFCVKEFKKPSDLARHLRTHTGEKPFACDQCPKKFSLKSTLEAHYRTHDPSATKNFVCEVCNSFFTSKSSRKLHMHVHTGAKPHKCNFCDQHFRTAAHRKCHEKKIHLLGGRKKGNRSNAKKITNVLAAAVDMAVNEATRDNQNLVDPENISEYSEIQVEFPDLKYSSESIQIDPVLLQQLQNSTNILLSEIDNSSTACAESVNDLETSLATDIISGDCFEENVNSISFIVNNLACEICREECANPDALKEHMELHLKKYECRQCSLGFSSIAALSDHEQSHLGTESYSCFLCDIVFFGIQQLKDHLRRVHQIVETCSQLIL